MKYVVVSPQNRMICFDEIDEADAYCLVQENKLLDKFCKDQELTYETMTPVEIGYAYVASSAERQGCRIYSIEEVMDKMKEYEVSPDISAHVEALFFGGSKSIEVDCPGYLQDVFLELTPIPVGQGTGGVYVSDNVDGASDVNSNSGI